MHYTQKNNSPEKYSETPYWWEGSFTSFNDFVQDYWEMYTHPEKSWEKYQKVLSKEKHKKDKIEKEQPYKSTLYTSPY